MTQSDLHKLPPIYLRQPAWFHSYSCISCLVVCPRGQFMLYSGVGPDHSRLVYGDALAFTVGVVPRLPISQSDHSTEGGIIQLSNLVLQFITPYVWKFVVSREYCSLRMSTG
jgi:hypothetical protein